MARRADAHIHLFQPGYVAELPESCRRIQPDERTLYRALAEKHGVAKALVVGYEGASWAAGNNQYLASVAPEQAWIQPVAFVATPWTLDVATLNDWQSSGFLGLSMYLFETEDLSRLQEVSDDVWSWLVQRRWLVSVNSTGESWLAWTAVLERHPELTLLVSHLGLPRAVSTPPSTHVARDELAAVCSLAQYSAVHVKLSGFYALVTPGYSYPHQAAFPYVETLLDAFGRDRLLWGSDFSPSLEWLSFPQTIGVFAEMPFLTDADRERIEGENLLSLLDRVSRT